MKMNLKILVGGGFLVIVLFATFVGYQFIKNRDNKLNIPGGFIPRVTTFEDGYIPPSSKKAIEAQVKAQNQLIRGKVSRYNNIDKTFTIAMEQRQTNGSYSAIGLVDVSVDAKRIKEFLCWPESFTGFDDSKIDLKTAYMGFGENSYLHMKGETKKPITELFNTLSDSTYVFALLSSPLEGDAIVENISNIDVQYITELAILGCNETN